MSDKLLSSLFYGFVLVVMGPPPPSRFRRPCNGMQTHFGPTNILMCKKYSLGGGGGGGGGDSLYKL